MKDVKVKVNQVVSLSIFDKKELKEKAEKLFLNAKDEIESRIFEIIDYLKLVKVKELEVDNISKIFKIYFYKGILNEAVRMCFEEERYNIYDNIVQLLNESKLKDAIYKEPMLNAFSRILYNIPTSDAVEACIYAGKVELIKINFFRSEERRVGKECAA